MPPAIQVMPRLPGRGKLVGAKAPNRTAVCRLVYPHRRTCIFADVLAFKSTPPWDALCDTEESLSRVMEIVADSVPCWVALRPVSLATDTPEDMDCRLRLQNNYDYRMEFPTSEGSVAQIIDSRFRGNGRHMRPGAVGHACVRVL